MVKRHRTQSKATLTQQDDCTTRKDIRKHASKPEDHKVLKGSPHARIQKGGRASGPLLENNKNIEFIGNTGPNPLKSKSFQASIQCWAIIGTPANRHLAAGPMMARLPLIVAFGSSHQNKEKNPCLS